MRVARSTRITAIRIRTQRRAIWRTRKAVSGASRRCRASPHLRRLRRIAAPLLVIMPSRNLALVVLSTLCFFAIARPAPARAEDLSLNLDPTQSTVGFTLGAFLHTVKGTFALKQGTITFDSATGQAGGNVVIDLASGQSGDAKRDANMRNNVLQVQT